MMSSFLTHLAVIFWIPKAITGKCIGNCSSSDVVRGKMEGYIVNGTETTIESFPHCVFLVLGHRYCGASVVNQRVVITAAHCMDHVTFGAQRPNIDAFAGLSFKKDFKANAVSRVQNYRVHEEWMDGDDLDADLALVYLEDSLTLNEHIKRVIISPIYPSNVQFGFVAGWGRISPVDHQTIRSHVLKVAEQTIRPGAECQNFIKEDEEEPDLPGVFCASMADDPGSPSKGDSGSGLITEDFQAVGVVSFSAGSPVKAVFYTNVSFYFAWILSAIDLYFCRKHAAGDCQSLDECG